MAGGGRLRDGSKRAIKRTMPFWSCAQLEGHREQLALYTLGLAGYQTYLPRIQAKQRIVALFPSYLFVWIEAQWHQARWSPGVRGLVMGGDAPAKVSDAVIAEIRSREGRDGLVKLPQPPRLKPGDHLRIVAGPFTGQLVLYAGQAPRERIAVLLAILGGRQRVELARRDVVRA